MHRYIHQLNEMKIIIRRTFTSRHSQPKISETKKKEKLSFSLLPENQCDESKNQTL